MKKPKAKARARVTMKARIAALDRSDLVQRLQDVVEHQKAAMFHRNSSGEINPLHGALHMPGLSADASKRIKDRGRDLLDALEHTEKAMDARYLAAVFRRRTGHTPSVAPSTRTQLQEAQ